MNRLSNALGWLVVRLTLGAGVPAACWLGEAALDDGVSVFSRSGQFVVHSPQSSVPTLGQPLLRTNTPLVTLTPDVLTVAAERVKVGVLSELGLADRWRGRITLAIRPRQPTAMLLTVVATRYTDGWHYRIELPGQADPAALVRVLVQGLLTELADRGAGPHRPEIPVWLVEGLAGKLLGSAGPDLVPQPNPLLGRLSPAIGQVQPNIRDRRGTEHEAALRAWAASRAPLTFNELSLPTAESLRGERFDAYRHSAQILLLELERLPGGTASLAAMVAQLTHTLNWQTAFLRAFSGRFARLLDAEKWWAVAAYEFASGREPHAWTREVSLRKLEDLLRVAVEITDTPNARPHRMSWTLQQVIRELDPEPRTALLQARASQLAILRLNAPRDLEPLITGYIRAIEQYLRQMAATHGSGSQAQRAPPPARVLKNTLRRLDDLDAQRGVFRNAVPEAADAPGQPAATNRVPVAPKVTPR